MNSYGGSPLLLEGTLGLNLAVLWDPLPTALRSEFDVVFIDQTSLWGLFLNGFHCASNIVPGGVQRVSEAPQNGTRCVPKWLDEGSAWSAEVQKRSAKYGSESPAAQISVLAGILWRMGIYFQRGWRFNFQGDLSLAVSTFSELFGPICF